MAFLRYLFDFAEITIRIDGQVSRKGASRGRAITDPSDIFIDSLPGTLHKKHPGFLLVSHRINSLLHTHDIC